METIESPWGLGDRSSPPHPPIKKDHQKKDYLQFQVSKNVRLLNISVRWKDCYKYEYTKGNLKGIKTSLLFSHLGKFAPHCFCLQFYFFPHLFSIQTHHIFSASLSYFHQRISDSMRVSYLHAMECFSSMQRWLIGFWLNLADIQSSMCLFHLGLALVYQMCWSRIRV